MSIPCPRCGAQHDVTLFAFGRTVRCDCGEEVDARRPVRGRPDRCPATARPVAGPDEDPAAELRRRADSISCQVLYSDLPRVDLEIAIEDLRDWVRRHLPDRLELFEMVYAARWQRFREQGWERPRPPV